ncbi:extracellular solute-binding protein [Methylobacillus sp.]|uniref:extracellular solute-binding protein n=1 Tax=Methylobacillus sp. TaxID=56818 RepID=UPI00257F87BF|nr:extracellular solute-binding protein [Methylobacillus sp.]
MKFLSIPDFFSRMFNLKLWLKLAVLFLLVGVLHVPDRAQAAHAVAQFGEPKYPAGFSHFDYANPEAPRGGRLALAVTSQNSSFDKFNPFSLRGKPAPGLVELMFETLTVYSLDETNTQYGLLADDIQVADDFSAATFHINPKARFSNGDAVTASDVRYSFDALKSNPRFKAYFAEISGLVMLDSHTVRFDFSRKGRDLPFIAGSLPVFSPKWGERPGQEKVPFDKLGLEIPIASGPYLIKKAVSGKGIVYQRNPDYWGNDIAVRRGSFNFGEVEFKLYKDKDTQVSALRAGDFDFVSDPQMRYWCCQYIGKRFDSGELVKEVVPHRNPPAMNGYAVNLRKARFQDIRVRKALNYATDFEWMNQKIFADEFIRPQSFFATTPLAATGLPSEEELKLLEPYRDEIPPEVFGPMFVQPSTKPPSSIRHNLTKALELFAEAGWYNRDGVLRNSQGEPFVIEVSTTRAPSPFMDVIYLNMEKLGIVVKKRVSDAATTRSLMRGGFNYDYTSVSLRENRMPGVELWRNFNSKDADVPGSENILGVKSRAVDELIQKLLNADSQEEQQVVGRALDRVLIHSHYLTPWRYLVNHYIIYNHRLRRPDTLPLYYGVQDWAINWWWDGTAGSPGHMDDRK